MPKHRAFPGLGSDDVTAPPDGINVPGWVCDDRKRPVRPRGLTISTA
jgi:hypothetical protein